MCDKDKEIIRLLQEENALLKEENVRLKVLEKEVIVLRARIEELEAVLKQSNGKSSKMAPARFKPNNRGRGKKRGAKVGHEGSTRPMPEEVDEEIELKYESCPDCGTKLGKSIDFRERIVEDIKPQAKTHVRKYEIHRHWCSKCKKIVYPKPVDVIPHFRFGLAFMLFVCFQKFGLCLPYNKIAFELETYFGVKVSVATLYNTVRKASELFGGKFENLKKEMRELKAVYVDETGWRIDGRNHWLWGFISEKIAVYKIDKSRGHAVPEKMLDGFDGVVGCDFYSAYNPLGGKQQKCWAHLLRETSELAEDGDEEIKRMHKRLKRLYRDATKFASRKTNRWKKENALRRFMKRLDGISSGHYENKDCQRIAERLQKHREDMFHFVIEEIEADNNLAEQGIRPNVVMRKISGGNRSDSGARVHEVMMSIVETYKRQDRNFFDEGMEYLQSQLTGAK